MGKIFEMYDIMAVGGRLYPFINAIRQSEIVCTHQHCRGEVFHCRIFSHDIAQLQRIAARFGVSVELHPRPSLLGRLRRYRLRIGVPVGILLCGGILFYFSNTAATIEIRGNSVVSDGIIRSVLAEQGIAEGVWIGSIDFAHCERSLRLAVPEITWVGIRSSGNRLVVEISEGKPQIDMLSERTPCNVVSMYDAQITDVRVHCGQLMRMIGDGVAKGELLVSGVHEDEKGHVTYHHAICSITGIYQKEAELSEYFTVSETSRTGRVHVRRFFRLFSLKIPMNGGNHGFSEYHKSEKDTPFYFLGIALPFGIVQHTFTETQTAITARTEDETRLALNGGIVRYEKNFLQGIQILDRKIVYSSDENGMSCHITYTLEGEIGTTSDFYVK